MANIITRDDLRALSATGAVVVEALPEEYYDASHIPGAVNLPLDATDARITAVLPDQGSDVVVYCSNLECTNSTVLAERLELLGHRNVHDYVAGKQDWADAALPLEGKETR